MFFYNALIYLWYICGKLTNRDKILTVDRTRIKNKLDKTKWIPIKFKSESPLSNCNIKSSDTSNKKKQLLYFFFIQKFAKKVENTACKNPSYKVEFCTTQREVVFESKVVQSSVHQVWTERSQVLTAEIDIFGMMETKASKTNGILWHEINMYFSPRSPPVFDWICVARSFVFFVVFYIPMFVYLYFFLFFFNFVYFRHMSLNVPLVSFATVFLKML